MSSHRATKGAIDRLRVVRCENAQDSTKALPLINSRARRNGGE